MTRHRRTIAARTSALSSVILATLALLALAGALVVQPVAAGPARAYAASTPGSGGWFWPVGTEDFSDWGDSWLQPRGAYVHVAQDMHAAAGHPVYAVGDGTVWISRADAGGYGPGGSPGGCMIIVHRTAAGQEFRAVYGHISGLRFKAGEHVTAGVVIATVNGCDHLHFGIHPSTVYRDGNMYEGHVPKSWADHGGWVDPVKFLKTNPRASSYSPPPVPLVEVTTATPPVGEPGARDGFAYWNEQGATGLVTYRRDLAGGAESLLAPGDVVPALDNLRYVIALLAAPASGFTVGDRLPRMGITVVHDTPAWGVSAHLTAMLTNASGQPVAGARVTLQRRAGGSWTPAGAGLTGADGIATLAFRPALWTVARAAFSPPAVQPAGAAYVSAVSAAVTLTPHVRLGTPKTAGTVASGGALTVAGAVAPRLPAGKSAVRLVFQRYDGTLWVTKRKVPVTTAATVTAVGGTATSSTYAAAVKLQTAGSWRVRAERPADASFAATVSAWRGFTVK
ncbi:MAG TPA: peptidoglycan DD-metalloendopeptidase family protein [Thermoleophilia bacterium]|nr:peptidoglycan DD-metalloendopeptidase family protein [Thermoleophilia bacterium]